MLFVDVRGFTALSEGLQPAVLAARMNQFYALASETVFKYDGTLDKLVGDGVMAFFGEPFHEVGHPRLAVSCAMEIVRGARDVLGIPVGAGIASGEAFVGNVGGSDVSDFTVLGDTVNVAARLCGAAKAGEVLVTEQAYHQVEAVFPGALETSFELKGKSGPVVAHVIVVG